MLPYERTLIRFPYEDDKIARIPTENSSNIKHIREVISALSVGLMDFCSFYQPFLFLVENGNLRELPSTIYRLIFLCL